MGIKSLAFATVVLFLSTNVNAAVIVDTGPGPADLSGWSLYGEQSPGGLGTQSLAGQFTITSDYTINSIQGWIAGALTNTFGTIVIYSDVGGLPGVELYSSVFEGVRPDEALWLGVSGISVDLTSGTYWAAFEVRSGQTMFAAMPNPVGNPLSAYAGNNSSNNGTWQSSSGLDFGIRISGIQISSVPVPASIWLFSTGLICLAGMARQIV